MTELKNVSGIDAAVSAIVSELVIRSDADLEKLAPLASIVTTSDNIAERKADRATINKMRNEYDAERKHIEKEWKSAIKPISDKYKAIVDKCDQLVSDIDVGLKEYEEQRVLEKRQLIRQLWEQIEVPEGLEDWRDLEDIYNPKWENATFKESKIIEEMNDAMSALKMSYDTLRTVGHKWEQVGIECLRQTGDLQLALNKMNEMSEHEQRIKEHEALQKAQEDAKQAEVVEIPTAEAKVSEKAPESVIEHIDDLVPDFSTQAARISVMVMVEPDRYDDLIGLLTFGNYDWRAM